MLLFVLSLAAAAAAFALSAVKDKDVLTNENDEVKDKTAVVRISKGVHMILVPMFAATAPSVLVR